VRASDDVVVAVRDAGKMYRLYDCPQDRLKQHLLGRFGRSYGREFWALREISFDMRRADVLGIIGCNGSGKSTLLQILAGVLRPTTGEACIKGRVAALLELESGFDTAYTGRDNIFMKGAILGIPRSEMDKRLEEIVAFAEIGAFIDQPMKTYSSGMFVRLALAVTISVDADVLLIDEALAVGDAFFRQKCYQRLEILRNRGVSIALVSHTMTDVEQFCEQVLLLHHLLPALTGRLFLLLDHLWHIRRGAGELGDILPSLLTARSDFQGVLEDILHGFMRLESNWHVGCGAAFHV
jgi:lipopolysaccharide transport system ATP-binding protein